VATLAAMGANCLWFLAGRQLGRRVLATLCRISISPDTCVRQNELSFARRGVVTLLIAKFVPGLSILAPPIAGALGMRARTFILFNLLGSVCWAGVSLLVGRAFAPQIDELLASLARLGNVALAVAGAAVAAYVGWRLWRRARVKRELSHFERVEPDEVAALRRQGAGLVVVDVRAMAPGLPVDARIPGARHLDMANLSPDALAHWPASGEFVTYCACPNDASAVRAAQWLQQQGRHARVLHGGIAAWVAAGHEVEVPA
jgi:membrane protein DedA with SNARE-associated domain/rhodanese-related sulfurtransferase